MIKYHFKKGIPDDEWKTIESNGSTYFFKNFTKDEHEVNKFLFDYYTEAFFYQYFSFIDILYKLINIRYNLGIDESVKWFNSDVAKKLPQVDSSLAKALHSHHKNTGTHRTSRNSMTHAFSERELDLRPIIKYEGSQKVITLLEATYTSSAALLEKIENLIVEGVNLLEETDRSFNVA